MRTPSSVWFVLGFAVLAGAYSTVGAQQAKSVLDGINAKPEYNDAVVADMKKILEAFKKTGTY